MQGKLNLKDLMTYSDLIQPNSDSTSNKSKTG